jgi:hypothetical protein
MFGISTGVGNKTHSRGMEQPITDSDKDTFERHRRGSAQIEPCAYPLNGLN